MGHQGDLRASSQGAMGGIGSHILQTCQMRLTWGMMFEKRMRRGLMRMMRQGVEISNSHYAKTKLQARENTPFMRMESTRGSDLTEAPLREWAAKFWDKVKIVGQASTPPCLNSMIFTTKNP